MATGVAAASGNALDVSTGAGLAVLVVAIAAFLGLVWVWASTVYSTVPEPKPPPESIWTQEEYVMGLHSQSWVVLTLKDPLPPPGENRPGADVGLIK